ncbi:MAG TPA: bifunctional phosphoribosylaminoimidazolecarboxamide formyltransferase/IMP cyclohydrolase [Gemmatimonadales bacterium]|nr:bifunctional phosphoribosylaminoimidazolecarboxamide formyltransferase/IMP cyclohydrolase [Gemmatimonadales bacterium]
MRALLSVSDKRGIVDFARQLVELRWEIVSTGGTAEALRREGIPVVLVEQVTGFPEMMDGRVKTLHPKVHGALLARRDNSGDLAAMQQHGITPIDLVAVNLYPFRETVAKPQTTFAQAIEQIDIGGPSMLRSAAKNHESVIVVVDPDDYPLVISSLKDGSLNDLKRTLATKVFAHTAAYDAAILGYLSRSQEALPETLSVVLERQQPLRYGENPHQRAALYVTDDPGGGIRDMHQLHGKELSFNNLLDVDAAMMAIAPWRGGSKDARPACVIIKHTTPCGIALGRNAADAYARALATDRTSAFGSVIAFNTVVDRAAAEAMRDLFVEVVVAPRVDAEALAVFKEKKNLRVVELPRFPDEPTLDYKRIRGGFLVQDRFRYGGVADESKWQVVTTRRPTDAQWNDLRFAWAAVGSIKSNAIILVRDEAAIGIGAGQMSRVDSSFLAVHKARQQGHDPSGAVLASDAFFPFRDGVDEAAAAGVTAIIQPGGSVKDAEVIAAADEHDLAMVLTGMRQFRH